MADTTLKERDSTPTVRRLRVTLDFHVVINDITQETVRRSYLWDEDDPGCVWELAERQQRLLEALLSDEQALHQYLVYVLTNDMDSELGSELAKQQVVEYEKLMERVYTRMGEADARFFGEVSRDGIWGENTELIDEAFVVDWGRTEVIKMFEGE